MSEPTSYILPTATVVSTELEIKRSRFLTFITRAQSEDEAREFIAAIKKQYPDARHHCSAFIFHVDGANPIERSNDDGEPSGTAGNPMLEVLRGSGVLDIVAVVVRYFGGIKLGTGGLVRAYSDAVQQGLGQLRTVQRSQQQKLALELAHHEAGRIEAELRGRGVQIVETNYGAAVEYVLAAPPGQQQQLEHVCSALCGREIVLRDAGVDWVEQALD